ALDGLVLSDQKSIPVSMSWQKQEPNRVHVTIGNVESARLQPAPKLILKCTTCSGAFPAGLFNDFSTGANFISSGNLGHEGSVFPADHTLRLAVSVPRDHLQIQNLAVGMLR